jgi:hypothetical protein
MLKEVESGPLWNNPKYFMPKDSMQTRSYHTNAS